MKRVAKAKASLNMLRACLNNPSLLRGAGAVNYEEHYKVVWEQLERLEDMAMVNCRKLKKLIEKYKNKPKPEEDPDGT